MFIDALEQKDKRVTELLESLVQIKQDSLQLRNAEYIAQQKNEELFSLRKENLGL